MNAGHEASNVDASSIHKIAAVFALFVAVVLVAMYVLWRAVAPSAVTISLQQIPPPPRLQANPSLDRKQLYQQQLGELDGYGWVDRQHGIAHIPITRAMAMLASPSGVPSSRQPRL